MPSPTGRVAPPTGGPGRARDVRRAGYGGPGGGPGGPTGRGRTNRPGGRGTGAPRGRVATMRMADPRRRLRTAFLIMCVVFSLFAGRLVQLQGLDASTYAQAATNERLRTVVVPAVRGSILDASGQPLAATIDSVTLVADQTEVTNPAAAALILGPVLDRDEAELQRKLTGDDRYVVVARHVSAAAWRHLRELALPGFFAEPTPQRVYPNGVVAANLLGLISRDEKGADKALGGLEERYDAVLAGTPGEVVYEKALGGGRIPQGENSRTDPVPGSDVRLTLDRDIQWYLERLLAKRVDEVKAESGSAMVVEAKTGRVLAMATAPGFDPTTPGSVKDEKDVKNRVAEEAYEPGSVEKPMTMAALLDSGTVTPDTTVLVPDEIERGDRTIHDFDRHPLERLTMAGVIARSSNIGTLLATERIPKAELYDYLTKFGYGTSAGLGLLGESAGVLPKTWTDLDRDTIAFGQTLAVSLPQITGGYQTLANGGVRVPLRLVDAVVDPDGTEHPLPRRDPVRVVSTTTAEQVTTMMEAVTLDGGTASNISVPGYRIAAKTGTAQKFDPKCGCYKGYTASFMGFAPADDPELVVTVSVQNPTKSRYGGSTAGPIWSDVMGFALQKLGVVPSGAASPHVRLTAG